jgi:hypothetical protein
MTLVAHGDGGEVAIAQSDCKKPAKTMPVCGEPSYYEYHNRMAIFSPLHQTYERIKTNAFYTGVEIWALNTWSTDRKLEMALLGEAELRFGWNYFYNGRDHVTPFAGAGVIRDFRKEKFNDGHHERKPAVAYGVFGLLYDHEFNSVFNLGFNLKGLVGGQVEKQRYDWGSPVGGIDIALPITFRFGYHRHWDIRIEPFDIYLRGTHVSRNYIGFRSTVGYRF